MVRAVNACTWVKCETSDVVGKLTDARAANLGQGVRAPMMATVVKPSCAPFMTRYDLF